MKIYLQRKKEFSLQRFHPWVFSGAIGKMEENIQEGDLVEVYAYNGKFLARGYYGSASIAVRVLTFEDEAIDFLFWKKRFEAAFAYRAVLGLLDNKNTTLFRLIHGEGDDIPGLVVDVYEDTAVFQAHTLGIWKMREDIAKAIIETSEGLIKRVFDKSKSAMGSAEVEEGYLIGSGEENIVGLENGIKFSVDWRSGQKTGFFIDQRDNRSLLGNYAEGKKVLNTFCYSGGFSIYALKHGAKEVVSIDVSKKAVDLCEENVRLNGFNGSKHKALVGDVFEYLSNCEETFDVIVLDPPAFAKSKKARHNALMAYKRLNELGIKCLNKGGLLFTYSCSQVVTKDLFHNTVVAAAISSERKVKLMHQLSQAADHRINLFHPEGEYLKGLALYVD